MSSVRRILACLCLVTSASMPCWAETEKVSPVSDWRAATVYPLGFTPAESSTTFPLNAAIQQTAGMTATSGKMSGKKKAWIIVGSVLGALVIGAAIGHSSGGSGSGGGGY